MYLFNNLFFFFVFICYYFYKKPNILSCAFGLTIAAIVCFVRGLFFIPLPIEGLSIPKAVFRFFVPMILIPSISFCAYCLFNKDETTEKINSFLTVLLPFYIFTLPFESMRIFPASFYACFMRPLIYFALLIIVDSTLKRFFLNVKKGISVAAGIFIILVNVALPCLFDAAFFSTAKPYFILILEICYCISNIVVPFFQMKLSQNSNVQVPDQESSCN